MNCLLFVLMAASAGSWMTTTTTTYMNERTSTSNQVSCVAIPVYLITHYLLTVCGCAELQACKAWWVSLLMLVQWRKCVPDA